MIEFFFDCSSPWTYLAFQNIKALATEFKTPIIWRPFMVGGVFNSVNPSVYESRQKPIPAKRDYHLKDLQDWAQYQNTTIKFPPSVFPVNSVKAMRACLVLDQSNQLPDFAQAVFKAYWGDDKDISQDAVLTEICNSLGINSSSLLAKLSEPNIKDALKANTNELIARGGFGTPTIFINTTDMYFGNDRMPLVRAAIVRHLQLSDAR